MCTVTHPTPLSTSHTPKWRAGLRTMTLDPLTIEISPIKGIALFSTSLMFVAIGAALVLLVDGNTAIRVIGWTSIVTFGFFGALWFRQIVTMRGPVLTIDHDGLIDRRVSEHKILWNQVGHGDRPGKVDDQPQERHADPEPRRLLTTSPTR